MNVYDKAHELAKALKHCNEYRQYVQAKEVIAADPDAKKMVKDFLAKQMELEYEAMAGKKDEAKLQQVQKMYELLVYNAKAREFLEAYMRFQRMMTDIYKILGETVAEGLDFIVKE
ncbi:MAG: YlbF family regulator [Negativicutes bacterium]|nr:YlbF family regulator [Negativicutes bacterium]